MKYFPYFFWAMILAVVANIGFSIIGSFIDEADRKSTKLETIYLPRTKNVDSATDFQIKLQLERRFLAQRGWRWDAPQLSQVNFALNVVSLEPSFLAPVENDNVALVHLRVVLSTAISAQYDKESPVYFPTLQSMYPDKGIIKYGLSYRANAPSTNGAFDENYVDIEKPHNLHIHCKDNGNSYPDLCYLDFIGPRGAGVFGNSGYAIMTSIWFRKERMPEWKMIKGQVDRFLKDKVTVVPFKVTRD